LLVNQEKINDIFHNELFNLYFHRKLIANIQQKNYFILFYIKQERYTANI